MSDGFTIYRGDGKTLADREMHAPRFSIPARISDAAHYLPEPGLRDAVNVAIALGQPLLLTGEPGTGKTQLAASVAHELGLDEPLVAHVKTTSTARDLFYSYDAIRHFHDAQFADETDAWDYIEFDALGLAILLANPPADANPYLPERFRGKGPVRSVVLFDEIDKAPRDLPNDVLNEIEYMTFRVRETDAIFTADEAYRPIVIMTSNSERNLPDAFLRRCVFYHLSFPDRDRLRSILRARLGDDGLVEGDRLEAALDDFDRIREIQGLKKKPATAELIGWVRLLQRLDIDPSREEDRSRLAMTYTLLGKTKEDLKRIRERAGSPE